MSDYQQIKKITFIRELTPKTLGAEQVYLSKEAQCSLLAQPQEKIDKLLAQAFKFFAKNKNSQEYKLQVNRKVNHTQKLEIIS